MLQTLTAPRGYFPSVSSRPAPAPKAEESQPGPLDGLGKLVGGIIDGIFGHIKDDTPHDGAHSIVSYQPKDASAGERERADSARSRSTVLFVNGAGSDLEDSEKTAGVLAQKMGRDVELIHNATDIKKSEGGLLSGLENAFGSLAGGSSDVKQVADDHFGRGHDPAVDSVKEELQRRLQAGETVDIVGHSQGNNIIARATRELFQEHPELQERAGNLRVLNMAGPTRREDYAPGITYDHVEEQGDFVPRSLGETMSPQDVAHREDNYDHLASPLAIGLGFLQAGLAGNTDHDPATILGDPVNMDKLARLFAE